MTENKKREIAQNPSVGADDMQSQKLNNNSIQQNQENINTEELEKYFSDKFMGMLNPNKLSVITMEALYEMSYSSKKPLVKNLIYPGAYLFVGAPKLGKSFLMTQLAYHVATGKDLWNFPVTQSDVLYLALEDDYPRLQRRLYQMFGTESTLNLHLTTTAGKLSDNLTEQLEQFITDHPKTRLVIIDTLGKIKDGSEDGTSYVKDYDTISQLKKFADKYNITLIIVHHTRKQKSDDVFEQISGTNGLFGAADGCFIMHKEKRTSLNAVLDVTGRDQQDQRLYLVKDNETLTWQLDSLETELWEEKEDSILKAVSGVVNEENKYWSGSATELVTLIGEDIKPNALTCKLNIQFSRLYNEYSVRYKSSRTHNGRKVELTLEQP